MYGDKIDRRFEESLYKRECDRLEQAVQSYHEYLLQIVDFILEADPSMQEIQRVAREARLWMQELGVWQP